MHRLQAGLGQQVHLVRNPATLRADSQGHRLIQATGAGRVITGMADQAQGAVGHGGQAIFDKRFEAFFDNDVGQDGVPCLFQAKDQLLANRLGLQKRSLPEALFNPVTVDQHHLRHAHRGHGLQHPAQHLGAWQGEQQGQRQLGRRRLFKADLQLGFAGFQAQQLRIAHQPADTPDAQVVTHRSAVDFLHVHQAPITQYDPVGRDKVGLFK